MSLSDKEREELAKLENVFYAEDPDFVKHFRKEQNRTIPKLLSKSFFLYGIIFLVGVAMLILGVSVKLPIVGVAGFVIMLGAFAKIYQSRKSSSLDLSEEKVFVPDRKNNNVSNKQGFMERIEQRWENRQQKRDEQD